MLRKLVVEKPKQWHQLLNPLMFAVREAPQASTGFSPFELLYGRNPRGILDLVKEQWEQGETEAKSVVRQVVEMREHLTTAHEMARQNLGQTQGKQKERYDRRVKERVLHPGNKVLLLLPSESAKLFARWQGPYEVVRKVGPVDYEIRMPDKRKKTQVFHINLLKEWHERGDLFAEADEVCLGPEAVELGRKGPGQLELGEHLSDNQKEQVRCLEGEFKEVFNVRPGRTHLVQHPISTPEGVVMRSGGRNWPYHLRRVLDEEVGEMLKLGVIEPSNSPWRSHPVLVPKPDGKTRFCIDFRRLNAVSKFDAYPMPKMSDLIERLGGAVYMTSLDLTKGYWQIPLRPEDKEKTAFCAPRGLFQFTHMPFGLHGAAATFQRLMDKVLEPVREFAAAYIDDIVVYSQSWEEHIQHLKAVLEELKKASLTVNPEKCRVAQEVVEYLGFKVGKGEIIPAEEKIDKVSEWPQPRTKKDVQRFIGLAGYYRQFIPQFAEVAAPLTDLMRKKAPRVVKWGDSERRAFEKLKGMLCSEPVRCTPDFSKPFILQTDASDRGIGAVLTQEVQGQEHPVLYLSRKLTPREERYSTIEKEALAIKWATHSLRYYLLGAPFTLVTDHAPLKWLNQMKDSSPRLTRWYLALQPYSFVVTHRKGGQHINADYFSRQGPWATEEEPRTSLLEGGVCKKEKGADWGGPSCLLAEVASTIDEAIERNLRQLGLVEKSGKPDEPGKEEDKGEDAPLMWGWSDDEEEEKGESQTPGAGGPPVVEPLAEGLAAEEPQPEERVLITEENPDTGLWEDFWVPRSYAEQVWRRKPTFKSSFWGEREEREKRRQRRERRERERNQRLGGECEPRARDRGEATYYSRRGRSWGGTRAGGYVTWEKTPP